MPEEANNRRRFLKNSFVLGTMAAVAPQFLNASGHAKESTTREGDGFTFLFQGDSITDGNRTRNNDWNHVMGHGYQYIISSKLWYDFPQKHFDFFNRGVSGNKVTDLAARWRNDTLDISPDVLSILIGINDVSAFINGNKEFGAEEYEKDYRSLLKQTKEQLPSVQLVLCEPFVLPVGKVNEKWQDYSNEVQKRRAIVRQLSDEFNAVFVPFQTAFNKALKKAEPDYWIWDGIHPMPAGHELMAREWLYRVSKKIPFIK